jgi:hypothetical protein
MLFLYGPGWSQTKNGSLSGFVFDKTNQETIPGANVYFNEITLGGVSNMSGYYVIPNIPEGDYTLLCQYMGYKAFTQKIHFKENSDVKLNIFLEEELIESQTIIVEAESLRTSERLFRQPVSKVILTPAQIKKIPQVAEADLLRSLQTLPGILPISDFSSALYVRGGTPDQNLYMIDGADVYNPEHAFGLFSTFDADAIKHVDMSKGGFGAEYGGRLSSVMDVIYLDGNREEVEGSLSIGMLSAKANIQVPIGKFGSVSGSIRRAYIVQTIGQFMDDIPNYYFYDMNLKAFFDINANNKLTISFFGGKDALDFKFNENSDEDVGFGYDWGNTTASLRYTRVFTPRFFSNFWFTRSYFSSEFDFDGGLDLSEKNKLYDNTFKNYLEYAYSRDLFFTMGLELKLLEGVFKQVFPSGMADVHQYRSHYVGFINMNLKPTWRWDIVAGLRYNYFDSERSFTGFDPRLALKYRLSETAHLKLAGGVYHQYLHRIPRGFMAGLWTTSDQYQGAASSNHLIAGFQKELGENFSLEIETYYKNYHNLYTYNFNSMLKVKPKDYDANGYPIYTDTEGLFNRGDGYSAGIELLIKKDSGPVTGWLGYSYAYTQYTVDGINQDKSFAPRHDRPSTINLVSNMDVKNLVRSLRGEEPIRGGSRWMFGLNFVYSSGQPITTPSSAYVTGKLPDMSETQSGNPNGGTTYTIYPSEINAFRLPPYARLDLSVTYEKYYKSWSLMPYVQVFNALNRKNIWFIGYEDESTAEMIIQKVTPYYMLPVLPTMGVNIKF